MTERGCVVGTWLNLFTMNRQIHQVVGAFPVLLHVHKEDTKKVILNFIFKQALVFFAVQTQSKGILTSFEQAMHRV